MKTVTAFLALAFLASTTAFAADFPKGSPKFKSDLGAALSAAKKEDKPVIAIFSAVWCGPCQAMKHDVYPSDAVKPYHDKFVWAYLDVDEAANEKAASQFGVSGIPHIQFLNSAGKAVDKQVGSSSAEAFANTLASVLNKAAK